MMQRTSRRSLSSSSFSFLLPLFFLLVSSSSFFLLSVSISVSHGSSIDVSTQINCGPVTEETGIIQFLDVRPSISLFSSSSSPASSPASSSSSLFSELDPPTTTTTTTTEETEEEDYILFNNVEASSKSFYCIFETSFLEGSTFVLSTEGGDAGKRHKERAIIFEEVVHNRVNLVASCLLPPRSILMNLDDSSSASSSSYSFPPSFYQPIRITLVQQDPETKEVFVLEKIRYVYYHHSEIQFVKLENDSKSLMINMNLIGQGFRQNGTIGRDEEDLHCELELKLQGLEFETGNLTKPILSPWSLLTACSSIDTETATCILNLEMSTDEVDDELLEIRQRHQTILMSLEDYGGSSSSGSEFDHDSTLVIVGAVVSSGLCIVALVVCFIGCWCRKKQGYKALSPEDGLMVGYHIQLDELELEELIGVGNFGQVYRGTWRGMEVAIKKLPLQFDEQMLIDFKREIEILRLVQHPNIVKFYGAVVRSPDFCIVTEFVANGSLYKILHTAETINMLDERMLKSVALDTAEGVKYLHTRDPPIIHRDIKSHNILLSKGWRVKICDFGLSKVLDKSNDQKKMSLCGTPSWAAPEVLRNQPYSEKADIYSFGIVLWEMVTKSDPFGGMPPFQIVFAVGSQGQRPPIPTTCPHDWAMLIRDCWDEDPNRRPTVSQIIARLQTFDSS